jgi:hypothetical protein
MESDDNDVDVELKQPLGYITYAQLPVSERRQHRLFHRNACPFCDALNFPEEAIKTRNGKTYSICCNHGKVDIPEIRNKSTPEPLRSLLSDTSSPVAKAYASFSRTINNNFQLGSTIVDSSKHRNFVPSGGPSVVAVVVVAVVVVAIVIYLFLLSLSPLLLYYSLCAFLYSSVGKIAVIIEGSLCHYIGPLIAEKNTNPRCAQVYFLDPSEQKQKRLNGIDSAHKGEIVEVLNSTFNSNNNLIRAIKTAKDVIHASEEKKDNIKRLTIALRGGAKHYPSETAHAQCYNLPQDVSEIAAIYEDNAQVAKRDILLHMREGGKIHFCYK